MTAPIRTVNIASPRADFDWRADGSLLVRNPEPLGSYPSRVGAYLEHWSATAPNRTLAAERGHDGAWRKITYVQAIRQARAIGQALIERGLSDDRPVMILSDNSIEHLLFALACLYVGVPYSPVSSAYSLLSTDFVKLRQCAALLTPGLLFAANGARFSAAIQAIGSPNTDLVITGESPIGRHAIPLADFLARIPGPEVDAAAQRVGPDHVAKILFTSGSTGVPKGVINTHRMLCSNQQMIRQVYPVLAEEPPVLLDWLPWSHTLGGNHDLGIVLANGGALYIDEGRPVAGKFEATVRNLYDVSPTAFYSVPKAFEELAARMRYDAVLRERFFARVKYLF
ncbi:MAG: AMP-binding protein, partial [Acetobacteraceae bacterium]|nr:AMP-binding protein [Acetobacteraceae bacterium]